MARSAQKEHRQTDVLVRPLEPFWGTPVSFYSDDGTGGQPTDLRSINAEATDAKIHNLFKRRGILGYARRFLGGQELTLWKTWAQDSQRKIYALDVFYELNANLGNAREHRLWDNLGCAFCVTSRKGREVLEAAVEDLRKYGEDEGRIHSGGIFESCEWVEISQRKSADVNLARELVYALMSSRAPSRRVRRFLRLFDQVMELVEDTEDVHEDGCDWNLNFWLTPIRQGRDVVDSVEGAMGAVQELCVRAQDAWDTLSFSEQVAHANWWRCLRECGARLIERSDHLVAVLRGVAWTPYEDLLLHNIERPKELGAIEGVTTH